MHCVRMPDGKVEEVGIPQRKPITLSSLEAHVLRTVDEREKVIVEIVGFPLNYCSNSGIPSSSQSKNPYSVFNFY